jgi:TPR repeat protein/Zn-dependent protease with chaperone function
MKRLLFLITLGCAPLIANAGVCDTAWDADKIVNALSGRPSYLKIPLKDQNQGTNEVTLAQVRAFHEAKEKIARVAGMSPNFIICGDREPNAFASPGSKGEVVGVTLGMLRLVDGDPDMAAAVIGHEIAHHVKRHGAASESRDAVIGLIGLIAGIALEYNVQKKHGVVGLGLDLGQVGSNLVSRKFDRDQEREADDLGFQYMLAAGFNPTGSIKLAELFSRLGHGGGGWFFDSHPGWDERGEILKAKIASSSEAQLIIARAGSTPRQVDTGGASTGQAVAFAPSYQTSEAQKGFQAGMALFRDGKHSQALDQFKTAANTGYPPAQLALGYLYAKGQGVSKDDEQAAAWYRKAAEQGFAGAQNNLGQMYRTGEGVPKDDEQAVAWYRKAAEQGYSHAQHNLGVMYANGQGVPKDDEQAVAWYRKAAEQGHANAQYNLGLMYYNGLGVPKDEQQAAAWSRKAAEQGHANAQFNLGLMYAKGQGVPKDEQSAYFWWLLASAQGNQNAVKTRDISERRLSLEQRVAAQTDARNWKPKSPSK